MPTELIGLYLRLPVFLLVVSRLAGLIMFQPILGSLAVPMQLRVLLALALAILVTPIVALPEALPIGPDGVLLAMGSELLLGGLIGLVVAAVFYGFQLAGLMIAQESGLAFGQVADPNSGEEGTVVSAFYVQFAGLIFLIVGGHRLLVSACLDSFESIPLPGAGDRPLAGVELALDAIQEGTGMAFRVAAPVMITLFLINLAMGFISRTLPQFNVISVGFALKTLVAFTIMAVSLPLAVDAFTSGLDMVCSGIVELIAR